MANQVNAAITDAVTQANVKVLAEAPAMAMGGLFQSSASAIGLAIQNAVSAQQNLNLIHQATTVQGVALLYAIDTAATAAASEKIDMSDIPRWLAILKALTATA